VKVLVVDDDRAVREALRRTLMLADYEVDVAQDGETALEQVVQALPDAVVLDVGLPGIGGLEVCRRVRRLGNRVPILILTARAEVDDRIDVGRGRRRLHGQAVRRWRAEDTAASAAAPGETQAGL
jgi:two-component system response regulator MprA